MASYTGLVVVSPRSIGGYVADKYWGMRRSTFWGSVLMVIGQLLMFFSASWFHHPEAARWLMYMGLGALIFGNGFFKPNVSTFVGQLYEPGDRRLDSAYTIFYMGVNLGAFAAPIICGLVGDTGDPADFKWGFLVAALVSVICLIVYVLRKDTYLIDSPTGTPIGIVPAAREKPEKADATPVVKLTVKEINPLDRSSRCTFCPVCPLVQRRCDWGIYIHSRADCSRFCDIRQVAYKD